LAKNSKKTTELTGGRRYKTLSIIIPVYNERKYLRKILAKVDSQKVPLDKEIILVDDCSKDGTKDILKDLEKTDRYRIFYHKINKGKGAAVRTGLSHANGDIILIQDADLEYSPKDYPKLLTPILGGKTQVVFGSRFKSKKGDLKEHQHITFEIHVFGNWFLTHMTNILFFSRLTDMETCYKVFTREVYEAIPRLKATRFDLEPEITAKILKSGFKIKEVPIDYFSRDFAEGKKITWRDGVKAAYYLMKYRVSN
jgi:glycosyltransferase involved in cell wall biosynthesis